MLERFFGWKLSGGVDLGSVHARDADAFLILEGEWKAEQNPA